MITFAIGDIHGCLVELEMLLVQIDTYFPMAIYPERLFVFLGDYVDRGPNSRGVLNVLRHWEKSHNTICLKGNHEDMLLSAVNNPNWIKQTIAFGDSDGYIATYKSFGVEHPRDIPTDYLDWMRGLPLYHDDGLRFFVHAGVDREPLHESSEQAMLWIRHQFLRNPMPWSRYVVHGHTPLESVKPDLRSNRMNLDTSCVFGGALTCAVFNEKEMKPIDILQVKANR